MSTNRKTIHVAIRVLNTAVYSLKSIQSIIVRCYYKLQQVIQTNVVASFKVLPLKDACACSVLYISRLPLFFYEALQITWDIFLVDTEASNYLNVWVVKSK